MRLIILIALVFASVSCANPPKFSFYGESLCPFTLAFIINGYKDLINNPSRNQLVSSIDYIPYGNAKEAADSVPGNRKFTCQHGVNECYGNYVLNCALQTIPNKFEAFNLCVAQIAFKDLKKGVDFNAATQSCADNSVATTILACANSPLGAELHHYAATKTGPHLGVPWFFLDGVHTDEIEDEISSDIVAYLCKINNLVGKVDGCVADLFLS